MELTDHVQLIASTVPVKEKVVQFYLVDFHAFDMEGWAFVSLLSEDKSVLETDWSGFCSSFLLVLDEWVYFFPWNWSIPFGYRGVWPRYVHNLVFVLAVLLKQTNKCMSGSEGSLVPETCLSVSFQRSLEKKNTWVSVWNHPVFLCKAVCATTQEYADSSPRNSNT